MDVIFDGEIVAWDTLGDRAAPFGTNRAVAEIHRNRRARNGTIDDRDRDLHKDQRDINCMTLARDKQLEASFGDSKMLKGGSDDQYWLKYVIFDVIYVGGPDAEKLISKSRHLFPSNETIIKGSIINLDLMRRKSILYNLIDEQPNEVELIKSIIIRSDGTNMSARDYFTSPPTEFGKTPCEMDSILLALAEDGTKTTVFDSQRRNNKLHEQIELNRALALENCFYDIVEVDGQEGLVFKDLTSPYYLGEKSRRLGYWYKLKADYNQTGMVADMDVVVLGGRWATGLRGAGFLSSFLVGIVDDDSEYEGKYMTLCKVNFSSREDAAKIMEMTGFKKGENTLRDITSYPMQIIELTVHDQSLQGTEAILCN